MGSSKKSKWTVPLMKLTGPKMVIRESPLHIIENAKYTVCNILRDRHVQPISINFEVFFIFKSNSPISTLEIPKIVSKFFFGAL